MAILKALTIKRRVVFDEEQETRDKFNQMNLDDETFGRKKGKKRSKI